MCAETKPAYSFRNGLESVQERDTSGLSRYARKRWRKLHSYTWPHDLHDVGMHMHMHMHMHMYMHMCMHM